MSMILVVDDNKNIREFCREQLEADGHCVIVARDGWEALRLFGDNHVDLVMLDVRMPGIDGIDVWKRIRKLNRLVPVIFFSFHPPEDFNSVLGTGNVGYVPKTWDLTELKQVVSGTLGEPRPRTG